MTSDDLKLLIEKEAARRNWSPATLCKNAVGNNRLYRTLENGGSCTLDVANRLITFIEANTQQEAAE